MNYSTKRQINQENVNQTSIFFRVSGNGTEWLDIKLPHPNYLLRTAENSYLIGWDIMGYESKYIQELRTRFITTFDSESLDYKRKPNINAHTSLTLHELKEFNVLDSIKAKAINLSRVDTMTNDEAFWSIKFYCEYLIKRDSIPSYQELEQHAYSNYTTKCKSTLRAKCRSIFNWYMDRDWKVGRVKSTRTKEEIMATRSEHAKNVAKKTEEITRKKVLNVVTGMFKEDYKKPNGTYNVAKIAKDSGTSRPTVMKYLKEIK